MSEPDRIEALAAECLARMETEGAAALDAICAEHPGAQRAMSTVVAQLPRLGLSEAPRGSEELRELGEYRILRRLGSGGMGVVYLAEHARLGRNVALKVLHGGALLQARARERFRREAQILTRLDHPNLCTVYDAGESGGVPYLAMRAVDGPSLAAVLQELQQPRADGAMPARALSTLTMRADLILLLEKVARALHAAHEAGVVHRDVKPGNVLVARDGEPIVVDFGLVRCEDVDSSLTRSGDLLGTPHYMAPEQIEPALGAVDRRTDVYALGVMAYECLTRRLPYDAAGREALYRKILEGDAPDPRAIDRRIPPELSLVVQRAMERDPAHRFATAAEFADELARCRTHQPIHSRRLPLLRRVWRWSLRNRVAAVFLATLASGLLVSLGLAFAWFSALAQADAALQVVAIRAMAERSPEKAFHAARELLRRQPSPEHASLVQELMGELRAEAVVPIEGPGQAFVLTRDGRGFVFQDGRDRPVLAGFTPGGHHLLADVPILSPRSVAFDAGGGRVAIGTRAGVIVTDSRGGQDPRSLDTSGLPESAVGFVSLSWRAGRLFAICAGVGFCIWNADLDVATAHRAEGLNASIGALSPCGRWVAVGELRGPDEEARVLVHDLERQESRFVDGLAGSCMSIAITADRFAAATTAGIFLIGSREGQSIARWITDSGAGAMSVVFSPDGTRLICGESRGGLELRTADGRLLDRVVLPATVTHAVFAPDASRIAAACFDQTVRVFEVEGGGKLFETDVLRGHRNGVSAVGFDPLDARRLVSCDAGGSVRSWRLRSQDARIASGHAGGAAGIGVLAGGHAASSSFGGELRVSGASLAPLQSFDATSLSARGPNEIMVSADGEECGVNTLGGNALAWRWRGGQAPQRLPPRRLTLNLPVAPLGNGDYASIEFSKAAPAGAIVVARPGDEAWRIWRRFPPEPQHYTGVYQFRRTPSGRHWLTVDGRFVWRVWDAAQEELRLLREIRTAVSRFGAVLVPDGSAMFLGGEDGVVQRWDIATGAYRSYRGHDGNVRWLAVSPDGRRLLTASSDRTLRLWDVDSTDCLMVLRGHRRGITGCCFTADGQRALSSSMDGTIREWWLTVEDVQRAADAVVVPELHEPEPAGQRR